ncbi:hypothetical protein THAOC_22982 [Thalassiosira oceanica]|uniref:Uncharacterized protein n=1 Tax=Thalassiosira oceanica TaxID=159749 RepID=K0S7Z1_THAOC|nr:hypothetical protein THAOC_22982 [Thalassiosira oceanica]|eukprot:EJK57021.1 hypothetical protein THAOC_22982 [Thalassiosira oceanica]
MWDCLFCRTLTPETDSQVLAMVKKRVAAGDPVAIYSLGVKYDIGEYGLERDVTRAVELYERAAELGAKEAHFNLGVMYAEGKEVAKDMDKAFRHYEAAATVRKLRPWTAAPDDILGDQDSLNSVKRLFMDGLATKADYAGALRGYQSAIEEMSTVVMKKRSPGKFIDQDSESESGIIRSAMRWRCG